jgi:protein phosphatase
VSNGFVLLVVADGVGGAGGGETASEEAMRAVVKCVENTEVLDPVTTLKEAMLRANMRVRDLQRSDLNLSQMASTLVLALVGDGLAWIGNLGDSRAYRVTATSIEPLTEDDSWVAEQVRHGALTDAEAAKSPYQNVITRGIGVEEAPPLDRIVEAPLSAGDHLLLCSDGLYKALEGNHILEIVKGAGSVPEAVRQLVDAANAAGGPDNISVSLYRQE